MKVYLETVSLAVFDLKDQALPVLMGVVNIKGQCLIA
jgi:hypothetical protein